MATSEQTVAFIVDQLQSLSGVSAKKMFGEYALSCDGILVGLICDNALFIKASDAGKAYIGQPTYGSPYPGAKPAFAINERIDDAEWLCGLVAVSKTALAKSATTKSARTKKAARATKLSRPRH